MPSWRAHLLVALLRLMRRKRVYASHAGFYRGLQQVRARGPAQPSARVQQQVAITCQPHAGHPVYTVRPRGPAAPQAVEVLYLHGGAYARPITPYHWDLIAELVARSGCTLTVPLYPLAPEHQAPAVLAHVQQVYDGLPGVAAGTARTVLMGDSAGGGLALALALSRRDQGALLPAQLLLLSPWVDVRVPHPAARQTAQRDPMLGLPGAEEAGRLYAGPWPLDHPYVSPLQAELRGLPPVALWLGTRDLLHHDALTLAERLEAAGVDVQLALAPEMVHVWPLLPIPEARTARDALVAALRTVASTT